jgi:hypothetical protein
MIGDVEANVPFSTAKRPATPKAAGSAFAGQKYVGLSGGGWNRDSHGSRRTHGGTEYIGHS